MHFKQLVPLLLLLTGKLSASSMSELLRMKYRDVYAPEEEVFQVLNEEDGTMMEIPLLAPLSLHADTLTDPDFQLKVENFEKDPITALSDKRIQMYLIKLAARDYNSDQISRDILNKCLESGPTPKIMLNILIAAAENDLEDFFFEVFNNNDAIELVYRETFFTEMVSLIHALIRNGRFSWLKWLISRGFRFFGSESSACLVCTLSPPQKVNEAIDFLNFLLVERNEFDVNTPVRYYQTTAPLLNILLKSSTPNLEFKEAVGRFLVSIGADVNVPTGPDDPMTAAQMAVEQGINLL